MLLFHHAGSEEPALACPVLDTGYLIRGHPDAVPKKVGNHLEDWSQAFTRMTTFYEVKIYKQTLNHIFYSPF